MNKKLVIGLIVLMIVIIGIICYLALVQNQSNVSEVHYTLRYVVPHKSWSI